MYGLPVIGDLHFNAYSMVCDLPRQFIIYYPDNNINPLMCTKCNRVTKLCFRKKHFVTGKVLRYTTEMWVQKD